MTGEQPPGLDATVGQARDWLEARMYGEGAECPCCTQFVKVYRRKLNAGMGRVLIKLWHKAGLEWTYLPHVDYAEGQTEVRAVGHSGEMCMTRFWGLIEPLPNTERNDGSTRVGWWRMTPLGRDFVGGVVQVQKYAIMYAGRCLELDGPMVGIRDVLGDKFDYSELMGPAR